jgi:hypothetical protein
MAPYSSQYLSIIFAHDDNQRHLAKASLILEKARSQGEIKTTIEPFSNFWPAEAYHQKYYLRMEPLLMEDFNAKYPNTEDFIASTAAARINGAVAGFGTPALLKKELDSYGLSAKAEERLLEIVDIGLRPACVCKKEQDD